MNMTRDQLRAARMLLHLKQDTLAKLSKVGTATIRRFETGSEIRTPQLEAIRGALKEAGAIFVDGSIPTDEPRLGIGVVLRPTDDLPDETRARIALEETREAERIEAHRRVLESECKSAEPPKPRGRPKKTAD